MFIAQTLKENFNDFFSSEHDYISKVALLNHGNIFNNNNQEKRSVKVQLLTYIPGMITHALAIPVQLTLTIIHVIASIFLGLACLITCRRFELLNDGFDTARLLAIDSLGVTVIDVIGVLCPPVAAKLNHIWANFMYNDLAP